MKVCPECQNPIRRYKMTCPYCGNKFSLVDTFANSVWQIMIVIVLLITTFLILLNTWDFKFA